MTLVAVDSPRAADPARDHDLTGVEVIGPLGEELGQIAALSTPRTGADATVLVEASGMLDVGHRYFTLRRSQLSPGEYADTVTVTITAADLRHRLRTDSQVAER